MLPLVHEPEDFVRLLEGSECRAVLAQELWHHGAPRDLVNALYVGLAHGGWARCWFDADAFRWDALAPEPVSGGEPAYAFRLTDVGARHALVGRRIVRVRFAQPDPGCARLSIAFDRGALVLDHAGDRSRLAFVEAPHGAAGARIADPGRRHSLPRFPFTHDLS